MFHLMDKLWSKRDMRLEGWFLMDSYLPTIILVAVYVYIVKVWGPKFMEKRKPYDIKNFLIFYNGAQVVFSAVMFIGGLRGGWWFHYNIFCAPIEYDTPQGEIMVHVVWWYFISKFIEFIDTFAFVARKKFSHVSPLHVIHHAVMPLVVWPGIRFVPNGHGTFFGQINVLVHFFMYFYYMVAAMGPQYAKYIWWKVHLTRLQITQFVLVFLHSVQLLWQKDCNYPRVFTYLTLALAAMFIMLFSHFYIQAYLKKAKAQAKEPVQARPSVLENDEARRRIHIAKKLMS